MSYLLNIGEGELQFDEKQSIKLPSFVKTFTDISIVIDPVILYICANYRNESLMSERAIAILTTRNIRLANIDDEVESIIPSAKHVFLAAEEIEYAEGNVPCYRAELMSSILGDASIQDHRLVLKPGVLVMLLRNLQLSNGHVNESIYIIKSATDNVVFYALCLRNAAIIVSSPTLIPYVSGYEYFPFPGFCLVQFPVRVCFVVTTNKAQ